MTKFSADLEQRLRQAIAGKTDQDLWVELASVRKNWLDIAVPIMSVREFGRLYDSLRQKVEAQEAAYLKELADYNRRYDAGRLTAEFIAARLAEAATDPDCLNCYRDAATGAVYIEHLDGTWCLVPDEFPSWNPAPDGPTETEIEMEARCLTSSETEDACLAMACEYEKCGEKWREKISG